MTPYSTLKEQLKNSSGKATRKLCRVPAIVGCDAMRLLKSEVEERT